MNIVNGVSRSPRNIDDTLDGSSQVCHLAFSLYYILSLLCSVFAERRECLAIGLGLSMHLDIASRKGSCSNRRNPSSNLSGGVNTTLELLPHVGHFLKHYNGITTALQQQSRIWGNGRAQTVYGLSRLVHGVSCSGKLSN